ncbi:hypothetical protein L484_020540 [Morus notabilis]|uniref:Uncharacterized protein n=1 Tax=Morus notabilis TaxID=981085 RepID=W9SPX3_9ROSA|nr:hypothetical protein L484_020540 [Morus notabilis]
MAYSRRFLYPFGQTLTLITSSRSTTRIGCILAVSAVFGSIIFRPHVSYAMDGLDILGHDDIEPWHASDEEENPHALWKFAKKFWLPVFFFLTVLSHLDDPVTIIALKVILFLLSTKPSPFSVYVFVNEFCHQLMRQEPHLYNIKSLYAHKVEVQDYKLLCLARVEVKDQEFTLVGILGGWWALPRLSEGPFSLLRLKAVRQP